MSICDFCKKEFDKAEEGSRVTDKYAMCGPDCAESLLALIVKDALDHKQVQVTQNQTTEILDNL